MSRNKVPGQGVPAEPPLQEEQEETDLDSVTPNQPSDNFNAEPSGQKQTIDNLDPTNEEDDTESARVPKKARMTGQATATTDSFAASFVREANSAMQNNSLDVTSRNSIQNSVPNANAHQSSDNDKEDEVPPPDSIQNSTRNMNTDQNGDEEEPDSNANTGQNSNKEDNSNQNSAINASTSQSSDEEEEDEVLPKEATPAEDKSDNNNQRRYPKRNLKNEANLTATPASNQPKRNRTRHHTSVAAQIWNLEDGDFFAQPIDLTVSIFLVDIT